MCPRSKRRFVLVGRILSGHPSQAVIPRSLMACYLLSPGVLILVFELLLAGISLMPGKHFSFSHNKPSSCKTAVLLELRQSDREILEKATFGKEQRPEGEKEIG